jgi:hypothetical protein
MAAVEVPLENAGVRAPMTRPPKMMAAISAAWPQTLRIETDTEHLHIGPVGDATSPLGARWRCASKGFGAAPSAG